MKLVVGLGNPGAKYERTRHNVGFRLVDAVAEQAAIAMTQKKFSGRFGDGTFRGQRLLLLKPTTYMNRSGRAVHEAVGFYKIPLENLLVVVDDLDLPLGRLRLRARGSSGGHRGLDSLIGWLDTDAFARLRIGIGRVASQQAVAHVLGGFGPDEERTLQRILGEARDAVACWLTDGIETAMNRFNRTDRRDPDPEDPGRPDQNKGAAP
jgi:PTH1 family peptidyl-tRNA hydrolase